MRKHGILLMILLSVTICYGEIHKISINQRSESPFTLQSCGLYENGRIEFKLDQFEVSPDIQEKPVYLLLHRSKQTLHPRVTLRQLPDLCTNPESSQKYLVDEKSLSDREWYFIHDLQQLYKNDPEKRTFVYEVPYQHPGYYFLWIKNCRAPSPLSMQVEVKIYNQLNGSKNYLCAGSIPLVSLYYFVSFVVFVQASAWIWWIRKSNSLSIKLIHHCMTGVILLKFCSVFFDAVRLHNLAHTGTHGDWSTIIFYAFSILKGVSFFAVVALLGSGWSYMTPILSSRNRKLLYFLLIAQVCANLAMIVVDEHTPGFRYYINASDAFLLLDMICCCAVLFPIVSTIRHLQSASRVDGKAARNLTRLKRFRQFYLLVVGYIYFTRIVVLLLDLSASYQYEWVPKLCQEIAAIGFYSITGYWFRPSASNPYLPLDTEEHIDLQRLDEGLPDDDLEQLRIDSDMI